MSSGRKKMTKSNSTEETNVTSSSSTEAKKTTQQVAVPNTTETRWTATMASEDHSPIEHRSKKARKELMDALRVRMQKAAEARAERDRQIKEETDDAGYLRDIVPDDDGRVWVDARLALEQLVCQPPDLDGEDSLQEALENMPAFRIPRPKGKLECVQAICWALSGDPERCEMGFPDECEAFTTGFALGGAMAGHEARGIEHAEQ